MPLQNLLRALPSTFSLPFVIFLLILRAVFPRRFLSSSLVTHRSVARRARRGFTLIELMGVIGIIAILMVLVAPAFTTIKSADDLTSDAYTIKGMLERARTYAKANNTYTWIGFAGSIGANTTPPITGEVSVAIVASKDGTQIWTDLSGALPPTSIIQIDKMVTLDNAHIGDTGAPNPDGSEFESRPPVNINYRIGAAGAAYDTDHPFTVQSTTFNRWIQFSPRGDALVKGGATQIAHYAEVGVLPTHGTVLAVTPNIAAVQISGFGGDVRIYRR